MSSNSNWTAESIPEQPKSHKAGAEKQKPISRGQKIEQNGGKLLMPKVGEAEYLIKYWQDLGLVSVSSNGTIPLSSQEMDILPLQS